VGPVKATLCIDDAVGETRRALLDEEGRPFRLEIERWSERGRRAKLDEIRWGRARARMGARGWFVDLGLDADGVLEAKAAITEGAMIPVRVKSEAWADKGPVLSLADMSASVSKPDRPGLHEAPKEDSFLAAVSIGRTITGAEARRAIDFAIEEAVSASIEMPGGGRASFGATRALTAIDVDGAGRSASGDSDLDLNLAAADECARQISLRGTAGLMVVDFVSMERRQEQAAVVERFRQALAQRLGRASKVLEMSALGLCEAAIARRARPIADALASAPEEREALDALRVIETEGLGGPQRIEAALSSGAAAWLEQDSIGWRKALADRIGARWTIRSEDRPPGRPKVWRAT
jgi:hypothetical protein